jgi:hypothetical protein
MQQKYNGWTNYETWRIALEWFDGNPFNYLPKIYYQTDADQMANDLREYVEESLEAMVNDKNVALDYALAFISEVNWLEIAENLIQNENA